MVAKFLATRDLHAEAHGFFVDSDNRIIYWHKGRRPGYVLTLPKAVALLHGVEPPKPREIKWPTYAAFLVGAATFAFIRQDYLETCPTALAIAVVLFAGFVPGFGVSLISAFRWDRAYERAFESFVADCEKVDRKRPKPRPIKIFQSRKKAWLLSPILFLSLAVPGFFPLLAGYQLLTRNPSDVEVGLLVISIPMAGLVGLITTGIAFSQIRGVQLSEADLYEPTEEELETLGWSREQFEDSFSWGPEKPARPIDYVLPPILFALTIGILFAVW